MHLTDTIQARLVSALQTFSELTEPGDVESFSKMVRATADPKFGDYQINCAMAMGKRIGCNPREVAERLIQSIDVSDFCEPPEIAGPGFINLKFKKDLARF